ncbi:MAG: hypothetical protein ACJ79H_10000 [Myxococcales bacterium]
MQPMRYYHQLKSTGSEVVAIDPTGSNRKATFRFDNIETRLGQQWCYAQAIRLYIRQDFVQAGGAGSVVKWQDLFRMIQSFKLACDDLGTLYAEGELNGPQLGLVAQIISNRYRLCQPVLTDVAAANGTTSLDLVVEIPLGHPCFHKGHQLGHWSGFYKNNGQLEVTLSASTWPALVSTGASASAANCDIRAELVYTVEPEARIPSLWLWRVRPTNANEKKHTIKDLCQGSGIKGASGKGKVAFLAYLTDVNGLGGADGVDNITRVYPRDRGQPSHDLGTPFFGTSGFLHSFIKETNGDIGAPLWGQAAAYPLGQTASTANPFNARAFATSYYLPYFWPDVDGQLISKLQEVGGDYYIEHDYTAVPAAQAQWITLEQSYLERGQEEFLMGARMGLPPETFTSYPKVDKTLVNTRGDSRAFATQQQKIRGIPKKIRPKKS